jgi:hypothetical protein
MINDAAENGNNYSYYPFFGSCSLMENPHSFLFKDHPIDGQYNFKEKKTKNEYISR